jgi:hypothetical protein
MAQRTVTQYESPSGGTVFQQAESESGSLAIFTAFGRASREKWVAEATFSLAQFVTKGQRLWLRGNADGNYGLSLRRLLDAYSSCSNAVI